LKFTFEIEGAWIAFSAILGDSPVIHITCQLCRILILLVLWLKSADADPPLVGNDDAPHPDVISDDLLPVAAVVLQKSRKGIVAFRTRVTPAPDSVVAVDVLVQLPEGIVRNDSLFIDKTQQVDGIAMHLAFNLFVEFIQETETPPDDIVCSLFCIPDCSVKTPFVSLGVVLQAQFQQVDHGGFGGPYRADQQ
jgi:hypothetical protein